MPCPKVSLTHKLEGSIRLRAFISESFAGKGSSVPFYFSPTIGGSDINGTSVLASYPDYRFRGPDLLLFRGTIEHSLGNLPIGALFSADEAKIGLRRDDIGLDHCRHSFVAKSDWLPRPEAQTESDCHAAGPLTLSVAQG